MTTDAKSKVTFSWVGLITLSFNVWPNSVAYLGMGKKEKCVKEVTYIHIPQSLIQHTQMNRFEGAACQKLGRESLLLVMVSL